MLRNQQQLRRKKKRVLYYKIGKNKLSEEEITAKVEEFKIKQNQILLTRLAEERQKEDDREKAINNAKDSAERTKLETQFGIERAQASARIVRYNEYI